MTMSVPQLVPAQREPDDLRDVVSLDEGTEPVRVLIVDDHKLFAEAIQLTLTRHGMSVLPVATTGAEALDRIGRDQDPDVALIDIGLPDQSGLVVGRKILHEHPQVRVLALTALDDPWVVQEAIRSGFHGYLTKDTKVSQFVSSIHAVSQGQVVVPARLARAATGVRSEHERQADLLAKQLTPREREILELLTQGATGQEISRRLHITSNTVRTHVQSILAKLQVHSRLEAVAFAVRHGIVRVQRQHE